MSHTLSLETIAIQGLDIASNERDLLEDLLIYLNYVGARDVKRMTRTNEIPKADSARIAKLLGDPEIEAAVKESGGAAWIDFIDHLAWLAGLVHYDVKGAYRGYSSSEPSFIDNYITVNEKALRVFLELAPAGQEQKLLNTLINKTKTTGSYESEYNEFFAHSVLGQLDVFTSWGSATGVISSLDFAQIRKFLFAQLQECKPGIWYSTASWVAALKANHPYFLIPAKIKPDRWGKVAGRYDNFYEGQDAWVHNQQPISAETPDAFERVEGRYIERFLEGIPLVMRFVDVAYDPAPYTGQHPIRGKLKAFRVQERFLRLMRGETMQPNITVQPNFDVIIESEIFPVKVMQQLSPLTESISRPGGVVGASVTILRLKKDAVAAELVRNPDLDVIALLRGLVGRDLPPNVIAELEEWSGHAEQFTLYEGFGLFEGDLSLQEVESHLVERITPHLGLVRQPEELATRLEASQVVPLVLSHPRVYFTPSPEGAQTIFLKQTVGHPLEPAGPGPLSLKRQTSITVTFPTSEAFDAFRLALAEMRCPFHPDSSPRTITLSQAHWPRFEQVIQQLAEIYAVEITDTVF